LISKFLEGIKNLWKWRKIIWNDRDWDHYYLLKIVEFKLSNMSKNIRQYGIGESAEQIADELYRASTLTRILLEDNVFNESDEKLSAKYGEITITKLPNGGYTLIREREKDFTEDELRKDTLTYYAEDNRNRKFIEKKLFRLLKNYREWWD
jgi:hypothetical protein